VRLAPAASLFGLLAASLFFYYGQNVAGNIGGPISIPKLLWLHYALAAWFVVAFFFWTSDAVDPALRRVYGWHLASFGLRGAAEMVMLYVTLGWSPLYGITHDLSDIAMITWLRRGTSTAARDDANRAARHFLTSVRLGLVCEIVFAALFHRATAGQVGLYFASEAPCWAFINRLTVVAVLALYPDLAWTLWKGRGALFLQPLAKVDRGRG
jgi:hypothetical protein